MRYPRLLTSLVLTPHQRAAFAQFHVLIQPGWHDSGPEHWQTHWQNALGSDASRIQHADWETPRLAEWLATAERAIVDAHRPAILVGHSLGCILAAYLATGAQRANIAAAFLAAPADVERPTRRDELANFAPIPMAKLPFPTVLVGSDDDPYCTLHRSRQFAEAWSAEFVTLHNAGHITAGTGYGPWPEGFARLAALAGSVKGGR